ncbi:hypothetical protein NC652_035869 [Populus alba x Populus x berolinensis]|nr:hypothetical protein NC652_035869 [Populus alba x Populus x berolinensis]
MHHIILIWQNLVSTIEHSTRPKQNKSNPRPCLSLCLSNKPRKQANLISNIKKIIFFEKDWSRLWVC